MSKSEVVIESSLAGDTFKIGNHVYSLDQKKYGIIIDADEIKEVRDNSPHKLHVTTIYLVKWSDGSLSDWLHYWEFRNIEVLIQDHRNQINAFEEIIQSIDTSISNLSTT